MSISVVKSFDNFASEVTGIRVSVVRHSVWSIGATVTQRVREALMDALGTYPVYVRSVYGTVPIASGVNVVGIPPSADKVNEIYVWDNSMTARNKVSSFHVVPTALTNLLYIDINASNLTRWAEIHFESRLAVIPEAVYAYSQTAPLLAASSTIRVGAVERDKLAGWPQQGFFQIEIATSTVGAGSAWAEPEMVEYLGKMQGMPAEATPTSFNFLVNVGFTGLRRGAFGSVAREWPANTTHYISPVIVASPEMLTVLKEETSANLMEYWLLHRSQYTTFTSQLSLNQMDPRDLMALMRLLETRAEARFQRNRESPAPTQGGARRRRDI